MRTRNLSLPEIALIAGTRVAFGIGVGLLLGDRFDDRSRRGAGWALLLTGGLSTIPIVASLLGTRRPISRLNGGDEESELASPMRELTDQLV